MHQKTIVNYFDHYSLLESTTAFFFHLFNFAHIGTKNAKTPVITLFQYFFPLFAYHCKC